MMIRHSPRRQPRGFTLLEILIVVALITTLLSILVMAIGRSITMAREAATRTTLIKLDGLLQQRLDAFRTLMDSPQKQIDIKSRLSAKKNQLQSGSPSITGLNEKMLLLMLYKDYYRQGFPQTIADNPNLGNSGQYFNANYQLPDNTQPFQAQSQNAAESSEMLYWLITQADTFGVPAVDDSEFSSSEVADTDGDGRLEFVDAWGQPLRFYRWPTRLLRPSGPATPLNRNVVSVLWKGLPAGATQTGDIDPLSLDPDDRVGVYLATVNATLITPTQYENLYHTPDTLHMPMIVSGGPDKTTGLNEPFDTSSGMGRLAGPTASTLADPLNSEMNDNLTNRQKQQK